MRPRNLYRIIIGVLFLIAGLASAFLAHDGTVITTILLAAGLAFFITGIVRHRRYSDDPEFDERSKKIGAYGLSYAWLTGIIGISLLFWLDYLGIWRLETQAALGLSVGILAVFAAIYQIILFRRGDVE